MVFKPGQSGNPGGRPKEEMAVKALAREQGPRAIAKLVEIMDNAWLFPALQLQAAVALLDRGFGKPKQEVEHGGPDGAAIKHEHSVDAFIAELAKLRKRMEETELPDSE